MDQEKLDKSVDMLMPEATELVEKALKSNTTKHGYGLILSFLTSLDKTIGQVFLLSCIKAGYPLETANNIKQIMGWI